MTTTTTQNAPSRLGEWFFRKQTLAQAAKDALDEAHRTYLVRAFETVALADHLLELATVEDTRSSAGAAITLYREALYWSLLALARESATDKPTLLGAFRSVPRHRLAALAGSGAALLALEDTLVRDDFVRTAGLSLEARIALATRAKVFVAAVLEDAGRPEARLARVRKQRLARPLGVLGFVLAIALGAVVAYRISHAPKDLADGRPFLASSQHAEWPLMGRTNGRLIDGAFFHTRPMMGPWVRIDLGRVQRIARAEIANRTTSHKERAAPLSLEVSTDGARFRTVARRTDGFETWEATFTPVQARYVRLRAEGRVTELHLSEVHVYAR